MTDQRSVLSTHIGQPTSDGAGVRLLRVIGGPDLERFDPFLMLDEFGSENPGDYIAGFPAHPHRGFETITYMLQGCMRHEDHLGHVGLLASGGVQWMTAGRGIIHSEMPEQQDGAMHGFQLWLNLPAESKLSPPDYRDFTPEEIPGRRTAEGVDVKVIAGRFAEDGVHVTGAIQRPRTEPQLFDLQLPAGSQVAPELAENLRVMLYVYEGRLSIGDKSPEASAGQLLRLSDRGMLRLHSRDGARVLLIAGRPLNEPIVQYGPFVMNSREEVEQALRDYRDGSFVEGSY